MSRRYHPDKNRGSKEAEAKFIKIQQAYEVLKDEKQRRAYDAARKYSSSRSPPHGTQQPGDGQQGDASLKSQCPSILVDKLTCMRIEAAAGDGFSFDFNGRDMKFEDIMVLLKQWEQQAPIDIREATTRFKTFVDVCLPPPFTLACSEAGLLPCIRPCVCV